MNSHRCGWGHHPSGGLWTILLIVIVPLLMGPLLTGSSGVALA